MRKKEILPCGWITWMDFEDIILNEIFQIERQIPRGITYRWNQKNKSNLERNRMLVTKSCPVLRDLTECSPPSSSVHGILQAIILELIAIPFSKGSS